MRLILWLALSLSLPLQEPSAPAIPSAPPSSKVWIGHYTEYEKFLRTAVIDRTENPKVGKTGKTKHVFFAPGGLAAGGALRNLGPGRYDGFFESYKSEVAAYKLDRLLQLDMVPPTVLREYKGESVSLQLWSESTRMLTEVKAKNLHAPDVEEFNRQIRRQKIFDDLVANIDENETNLLFDLAWNVIKIDHSRAFTPLTAQPFEIGKTLNQIDRPFFERIKALDKATVTREIGDLLESGALNALFVRRDAIVKAFEKLAAQKGANQVLLP